MAEFATLARPYAEAVLGLAKASGDFTQWSDDLRLLTMIVKDSAIAVVIANPRIEKSVLTNLLLDICADKIGSEAQNLVKVLIDNNRLSIVPYIAQEYEMLKAQQQGYETVELTSAFPVTEPQEQELSATLQKRLGKTVNISVKTDESLMGGWLVRVGDQVIDASIKGRLQQLATELRR
ncbi:ATP synthase, F1 delta subunit [Beggiatoa alba B18LD]|uniref:ATP synthase subunit delta n=1 Tax=Beggiatoa alba B18LD TaxID=395493 RepID=I3CK16_9GAMM|nr:F0F1 ATP synthase subunit delta [Beggiatoa alba]EIJ43959.1 ATP synthase, F1 delta subunit [Beggiatoa alba B18LD]